MSPSPPTQEGLHRTRLICPSAATQAIPLARAFAFVGSRFRLGVCDLGLSTYFATEKSNLMSRRGFCRLEIPGVDLIFDSDGFSSCGFFWRIARVGCHVGYSGEG